MTPPPKPRDEAQRLEALLSLALLDTPPEERFDRYTRVAQRLFDVPIAVVSLVGRDRQWFKSIRGLDACETSREVSFCGHAILRPDLFIVEDATRDPRFADNPLVTGAPEIRFYAGCPLITPTGYAVGTLCLIDTRPRSLDEAQRRLLRELGAMVEDECAALHAETTDSLTGLSNREGLLAIGRRALRRPDAPATLLNIDLEDFKSINERFGDAEGDRALQDFAHLLLATFRKSDLIARLGGDRFCVLCTGTDCDGADLLRERLDGVIDTYNRDYGRPFQLGFSAVVMPFDRDRHACLEAALSEADDRLSKQKSARRFCA
jgi:diguanylate cyclase (GGDEF)-like protein